MMVIVTNIIPTDSADYLKVRAELEELAKNLPETEVLEEVESTSQLTQPEVLPSPVISPPIELPKESTESPEIEIIE